MRITRLLRPRRGAALPLVIGAIVIIGGLIAGALFAATQEYRIGRNTVTQTQATGAAELGIGLLVQNWDPTWNKKMVRGDTLQRTYAGSGGTTCNVTVTRVEGPFFWVVSEAWGGGKTAETGARRRVGTFLRLDTPEMNILGALTGRGALKVGGSSIVSGKDKTPTGWPSCSGLNPNDVPGVAMSDTVSQITMPGCSVAKNCIEGDPKWVQTSEAADTATYFQYGNSTYNSLAAQATIEYPGDASGTVGAVVTGGVCDKSVMSNWGDPNRAFWPVPTGACEGYMPIIHIKGSGHFTGGSGQGILLVDGDLKLTGGFTFYGPIIVRGVVGTYGNGAKIYGAVMAANIDLDDTNTVLGNSGIYYSSCALQTVFQGSAKVIPAIQRSWTTSF
jgi:hypothetical protein